MTKPTIIDISKATGFSKSTISKALNNSEEIEAIEAGLPIKPALLILLKSENF